MSARMPIAPSRQHGAISLLVALLLLVAITMVSLFTSKTLLMEQRMSANEQRTIMAFEAADAGASRGLAYADKPAADLTVTINGTLPNGAAYRTRFIQVGRGRVRVVSSGKSADGVALRTVAVEKAVRPILVNPPITPLTTHALTQLGGDIEVVNNVGHLTIWSGKSVTTSGNAKTRINVNGVDNVISSSSNWTGPDVIAADPNLASISEEKLFESFFADTQAHVSKRADLTGIPADPSQANGCFVWHDGDLTLQAGLGSRENPVVLVVDGNLHMNADAAIYGMVYVTGSVDKATGHVDIYGALVVAGSLTMGNGSLTLTYDPATLANTDSVGTGTTLSGSWKDWS